MFRRIVMLINSKKHSEAKKYLEKNENFSLILADNTMEALRKVHTEMPELLMLELDKEKGLEMYYIAMLKEHRSIKDIPMIFLSKNTETISKETENMEKVYCLQEPFTEKELNDLLDKALKTRSDL